MKVFDLQSFLNDKKYTQKELAGLLSCSQAHISAVLSKKKHFTMEKLKLLESYFGDISNYITEIESPSKSTIPPSSPQKYNQEKEVIINRDILDVLKTQSEAILSQQKTIEKIVDETIIQSETILSQQRIIEKIIDKKINVQKEENAECAAASGSDLEK